MNSKTIGNWILWFLGLGASILSHVNNNPPPTTPPAESK